MLAMEILLSGRDSLLVAVPFVLLLCVAVFRLDEEIVKPKTELRNRAPMRGIDENGEPIFTDPDGRVVKTGRPR